MSERAPDDTPKSEGAAQTERAPRSGSYYYDDATGYELYDPAPDDDEDDVRRPSESDA